MKKLTVILLIAVLAMASVFAAIDAKLEGSVTADYTANFSKGTYTFTTPAAAAYLKFDFGTTPISVLGDGFRAEVTGKLAWKSPAAYSASQYVADAQKIYLSGLDKYGYFKFSIDSFDIKNGDIWTLNLLEASEVGNFAVSPVDTLKVKSLYTDLAGNTKYKYFAYDGDYGFSTDNGITMSWNNFTFALANDKTAELVEGTHDERDIYFGVQTPNFTMGNSGMTIQGAGAVNYYNHAEVDTAKTGYYIDGEETPTTSTVLYDAKNNYYYILGEGGKLTAVTYKTEYTDDFDKAFATSGSLKLGYTSDAMTITAAADALAKFVDGEFDEISVDAVLTGKFAPATFNVYYATDPKVYNTETYKYITEASKKGTDVLTDLLSTNVVFDLRCFHAPIDATIIGLNLLNGAPIVSTTFQFTLHDNYIIGAYAKDMLPLFLEDFNTEEIYYTTHRESAKVGVYGELTFGNVEITAEMYGRLASDEGKYYKSIDETVDYSGKRVGGVAGVTYTHDYFTVEGSVTAELAKVGKRETAKFLQISTCVESDKLLKNAVIGVSYDSGNLFGEEYFKYNAIYDYNLVYGQIGSASAYVTVAF